MSTDEYGVGLWLSVSHALQKYKSTWHTLHHVPLLRTHPYTSVLIRTALLTVSALRNAHSQPVGMCIALGERTALGARGETLLFPPCTPFSPVCCKEACGTQCGSLRLDALAPFPARREAVRLSARCHSAAPNFLGAVAAPLCSNSLLRPLRARHSRPRPVC